MRDSTIKHSDGILRCILGRRCVVTKKASLVIYFEPGLVAINLVI